MDEISKDDQEAEHPIEITRRSSWSGVFIFLGIANIIMALVGCAIYDTQHTLWIILLVAGFVGAIQSFFLAFMVNVFTDIRWFLSEIASEK